METTVQSANTRPTTRKELSESNVKFLAETEALLAKGDRMMEEDVNDIREKLGSLPEIINLSAVAKHCFGKSRTWLYQRINGNKVNGKIAAFTDEERLMFRKALQDLSEKMSAVAMNL